MIIRKADNYNFVLSVELDEPKVSVIKGKEIVYKYKNLDVYTSDLYYAIRALIRHSKSNIDNSFIPNSLKYIKPNSDEELYMPFLEVRLDQIQEIIKKEYYDFNKE
jgi:hypothetical protein